jgi:hypothetical protein
MNSTDWNDMLSDDEEDTKLIISKNDTKSCYKHTKKNISLVTKPGLRKKKVFLPLCCFGNYCDRFSELHEASYYHDSRWSIREYNKKLYKKNRVKENWRKKIK